MACDPAVLIEQAKCILKCIPAGMMSSVNTALLCQIANAEVVPPVGPTFPAGATNYYRLGETSGNPRIDSVGAQNLAEVVGTVGQAAGISGNAANWAPSTGRLFKNLIPQNFLSPVSCSFWVNVDNLPGITADLIQGGGGDEDIKVKITSGGNIVLYNVNDGDIVSIALGALDAWHLVVVTVSGTSWSMSIDGGALNSGVVSNPPSEGSSFTVGTVTDLDSSIDEIAVFANKILTAQEISDIWNGGTGTFLP